MAVTTAELGFGTILKFGNAASPEVFTTIEMLKDVPEFGDDTDLIDVTHQESPDTRKEYIAGLLDGSEVSFTFDYSRTTTQDAVRAAVRTKRNFQLVYSTTPALTMAFPAVILSAKINAPVNGPKQLMLRLKPSGDISES